MGNKPQFFGVADTVKHNQAIKCKVCDAGEMSAKTKYRLNTVVALIGYILLIPSVIGMLLGVLFLFATGSATSDTAKLLDQQAKEEMQKGKVPPEVIEQVLNGNPVGDEQRNLLDTNQRNALDAAVLSRQAGQVGAGAGAAMGGGLSVFMIISSFVGGLLGWLLTMKKKVLQCNRCSAIIAAS